MMVPRGKAGGCSEVVTIGFQDLGMEMAAIPRPCSLTPLPKCAALDKLLEPDLVIGPAIRLLISDLS
jgi:hypothetical protein